MNKSSVPQSGDAWHEWLAYNQRQTDDINKLREEGKSETDNDISASGTSLEIKINKEVVE